MCWGRVYNGGMLEVCVPWPQTNQQTNKQNQQQQQQQQQQRKETKKEKEQDTDIERVEI